jgi:Spondin_N
MNPSPDWFTGFYMHNVIDEYDRTFWSRFKILTYPWDAGTDAGTTYTEVDRDLEQPEKVQRITVESTTQDIFMGSNKTILPVGELECILHVCDLEEPDCVLEGWPASNGCDILRFADCDTPCDPANSTNCQECKPKSSDSGKVYYRNCCESNYDPASGDCSGVGSQSSVASAGVVVVGTTTVFGVLVMAIASLL